jgi:peptidyl-prolyl cis-trans isomerase B (cyclophilin B)
LKKKRIRKDFFMSKMNKTVKATFRFMCIAVMVLAFLYMLNTCFFSSSSSTKVDMSEVDLIQLDALEDNIEEGQPIAIITTSLGEIRAVLYPDEAPNTVANFISLAESGYYDGTYIFRVQPDVYFAGGGKEQNGDLAQDFQEENETVKSEISEDLWPFRGAFMSISSKSGCSGSRFIVINSVEFTDEFKEELISIYDDDENPDTRLADAFIQYGGAPNVSQEWTIFAQTYQGFDVIDKICGQDVNDADNEDYQPTSDIIIEKVEISTYSKDDSTVGTSN